MAGGIRSQERNQAGKLLAYSVPAAFEPEAFVFEAAGKDLGAHLTHELEGFFQRYLSPSSLRTPACHLPARKVFTQREEERHWRHCAQIDCELYIWADVVPFFSIVLTHTHSQFETRSPYIGRLTWNSQRSTCLCLLRAGIRGVCHHTRPRFTFLSVCVPVGVYVHHVQAGALEARGHQTPWTWSYRWL